MRENHKQNQINTQPYVSGGFLNGVILGFVAGAFAYYLFGTEKGQQTKELLLQELNKYLKDFKQGPVPKQVEKQVREQVKEVKKVVKKVEKQAETTKEVAQEELKELQNSVTQAKKTAEEMQKNLQKAASRIEKKFFTRKGKKLGK